MKKFSSMGILALLVVLMVGMTGCSLIQAVRDDLEIIGGSGRLVSRTYEERDFTKVATGYGAIVDVMRGDDYAVLIEMDDNLEPYVEVTNTNGRLSIMLNDDKKLYTNTRLNIAITMPALEELELSGGSMGTVTGFGSAQPFHVTLSGGSQLRGDMESGNAEVGLSGGSKIDLSGIAGDLNLNASGGSFVYLGDFLVQDVTLDVSGGGEVELHPSGVIRGQASGGTTVHYDGEPTSIDVNTSGGASVSN